MDATGGQFDAIFGRGSVLVDGFVAAGWRVERAGDRATMVVMPAVRLSAADRNAVAEEAERLLAFLAADIDAREVRFDAA